MKLASLLAVAVMCCVLFVSPAQAVLIDFNSLAVGTVVTNQYAASGVLFSPISGNAPIIANDGPLQVLSPNPPYSGDFRVDFTGYARNVCFDAGFWDQTGTAVVDLYGAGGGYLGTVSNTGNIGGYGLIYETFDLTSFGQITRIDFNSAADPAGGAMDNLKWDNVPEPGSLLLLGTGIAALARYRRRRNA